MKYIIIILLFVFSFSVTAQQRSYRQYYTQQVDQQLRKERQYQQKRKSIEKKIQAFRLTDPIRNIALPIIFHNIYHTSEEQISTSLILSQLETLNAAFRLESDWKHPGHDIEGWNKIIPPKTGIQFCLGNVKIKNNRQPGIQFIPTDVKQWGINDSIKVKKTGGIAPYKPDQYLNIWIANLGDKTRGYAQMPWGDKKTDGIVIDYRAFGSRDAAFAPYHKGKTLVHLVGSYLGLYELWDNQQNCQDDRVSDTPIHNGPNYGPQETYRHISMCGDNPIELTPNYMDATDDAFIYFFTYGQVARMQAILQIGSIRKGLVSSLDNCAPLSDMTTGQERSKRHTNNEPIFGELKRSLSISPNPTKNILNITISGSFKELHLFVSDISGRLIQELPVGRVENIFHHQLDCSSWSSGIYFIRSSNGQLHQKFIVKR